MGYFGLSHPRNIDTITEIVLGLDPISILDVGCGGGTYGQVLRPLFPRSLIVGVEAYENNRNPLWACYNNVTVEDVRGLGTIFEFELVLLVDVLEHMPKEDGIKLLDNICGTKIVCTPRHWPQSADENPYTEHVSEWTEADFNFSIDLSDEEFVIGVIE
jgi:hypothetical protein